MKNIVVLISGRGSNLAAILDACNQGSIEGRVVGVISNRADAGGLSFAKAHGVPAQAIEHRAFGSREEFDAALAAAIQHLNPDLVLLAGFMRILTPKFVATFAGKMLNIHPSLLPHFPGLDTHERALAAGVATHGASVHYVTADLDAGPVLMQVAVPVLADDSVETLQARVLSQEHRLYTEAVRLCCADAIRLHEGRILHLGKPLVTPLQLPSSGAWTINPGSLGIDVATQH